VRDIYNYFLLRKVRKIISWNAMFLHCTLHQCVLLVPFYSPLGNVFWPSREECHNDAWDIFMVKLWCRCRCRNIALQHITNPLMNNNSFCCSKSQVQRNHHTLWEYPYQKKKVGLQQVAIQITIKSPYIGITTKGFQDCPHNCHSDRQLSTDYMFIFHPIN